MLIKKMFSIMILLILSIVLTSCAGSREISELAIVIATGIDLVDGKVLLTNEVIKPNVNSTKGENNGTSVLYLQHEGDTVFDAIRNATLTFDRKLLYSHNEIYIFGEELAKRGIGDYINFLLYDIEPRESAFMVVAKDAKAYEVMGINEGLSTTPGKYLELLIENHKYTSKTRSLNITEYIKYYYQRKTPVLGVVNREQKKFINHIQEKGQSDHRDILNVEGGAVFFEDSLIGYYSGEEMIGFNFLVDEIGESLIVFEVSDEFTNNDEKYIATKGKYTVLEIKDSKTKNDLIVEDGKINLTVDVKLRGVIGEDSKGLDFRNLNIVKATEEACSHKVKEYISQTMDKAQKDLKVDTFGVDTIFHSKYPEEWKEISNDWESIFPEISYNINVETFIIRTGLLDMPTNVEKGESNAK